VPPELDALEELFLVVDNTLDDRDLLLEQADAVLMRPVRWLDRDLGFLPSISMTPKRV
jgi:hypothetical protein